MTSQAGKGFYFLGPLMIVYVEVLVTQKISTEYNMTRATQASKPQCTSLL
jgi:hypothetical protein